MKNPFEKTTRMINEYAKPALEFLRVLDDEDMKLQALRVESLVERLEDLTEAASNPEKRVALFEFGLTPQLFYVFDCLPLCMETFPMRFTATQKQVVHEFLDAAESSGLPSDVCSTDRFLVGAALSGEFPKNAFFVTCSGPCDGTRIAYPIMQKALEVPTLFLELPSTYERESARWYGQQIRKELIPFLEEVTGKKFDGDRFREIIEESNRAYELMLDVYDTYTTTPMPVPATLRGFPWEMFLAAAGHPRATKSIQTFHAEVMRRLKEGIPNPIEEKHRVIWGHVPPTFDPLFFDWMEKELKVSMVMHMLSGSAILRPIDTTSVETMFEGYAWQGLDMTMSLMRFDSRKILEYTMKLYHQYRCDSVIMTQHVGCNSICGAGGIMRRYFQREGIPALFLEMDYNDDRIVSSDTLKNQIEEFFSTI
ncbi:MAG: 2-hydroxyacyl-CoA dehydratase [Deltaproteobacteria bacterium]|nr:2-hydroxyacyl-CoA dehydratase [Deltaproteobacteria bacterium]